MYIENLKEPILFQPIYECGADCLKVISGYATHTMASWHLNELLTRSCRSIELTLIIGMCRSTGLGLHVHEGFKDLVAQEEIKSKNLNFVCKYVVEKQPVHSKIYIWERGDKPIRAFIGSANYTQLGFSTKRREVMVECDPVKAQKYYESIEPHTAYCNYADIEEYINFTKADPVLNLEKAVYHRKAITGEGVESMTLSLLTKKGVPGDRSGLNWGQREGREPNQAYIPLPSKQAKLNFFPLNKQHFSVCTDDGKHLIFRVEQENNKAITTPLNNSLIGEYFRRRLGLPNGAYVTLEALKRYGRTHVTFYKIDDEHFYMDFSNY